jgi:2-polyprenyl-6-hydroxyphenyl methylase/3-demethylubiquinone-9 3-methyltransferase
MILGRGFLARSIRAARIRAVKKWGGAAAKARLWDSEFASGQWTRLDHTMNDPLYRYLEQYAGRGNILDLGCGSGNTGNELDLAKYSSYTGTDISAIAVRKAEVRTRENGREGRNEYICACIESFVPTRKSDVILFRESIFYIPRSRIKAVLDGYVNHLTPDGVFIVRMCDREKYKSIVNLIDEHYCVIERHLVGNTKGIILVFKPHGGGPNAPLESHATKGTGCLD